MSYSGPERRQEPRFSIQLETTMTLAGKDTPLIGMSRDISVSGIFVYSDNVLPPESGVTIFLKDKQGDINLELKGTIVHSLPGLGMGIQFNELDPENREILQEIVNELKKIEEQSSPQ